MKSLCFPFLNPLVFCFFPLFLSAQPGTPDPGFSPVIHNILGQDEAFAIAVQPDGKIVLAGLSNDLASVARYTAAGSIDNSFSGDGAVSFSFSTGGYSIIRDVLVQPDGKIVVGGTWESTDGTIREFALARFNPDGSFDTGFSGDGKVLINLNLSINSADDIYSIALQPDGKILAAGAAKNINRDMAVACLLPDGTIDSSFYTIGWIVVDIYGSDDICYSMALLPDGRIFLVGNSSINGNEEIGLVRLTGTGNPDFSFDGDGKMRFLPPEGPTRIFSTALQADGKIVGAGDIVKNGRFYTAVVRFTASGLPDNSFDGDGFLNFSYGGLNDEARSVKIQADGKIVVAGRVDLGGTNRNDIAIARLTPNGQFDTGFDGDGKKTIHLTSSESATDMVLVNNRVYLGGIHSVSQNDFLLVALQNNGAPLITSIRGMPDDPAIRLYPNPSAEWIFVEIPTNAKARVSLYNNTGMLLQTQECMPGRTAKIKVSALPAGLYHVEIRTTKTRSMRSFVR